MHLPQSEVPNPLLRRQQQVLQGACPNGGSWWACSSVQSGFVGCCTVNPCTSVGCAAGNIRAASLGTIAYGSSPDQACRSGGQFYTCSSPSFWGCCKSVPCGTGCPQADLAPASLSDVSDNPFAPPTSNSSGGSSTPTGAIAGGVIAGVLGIALIGVLIWWFLRRRRNEEQEKPNVPMAYNQQPHDNGANIPLTYPEAVDSYAQSPGKVNPFPPSAYQSPALPRYDSRRVSYEIGSSEQSGLMSPPLGSPGFSTSGQSQMSRPMSYELVGSPAVGGNSPYPPSTISMPVSELPAEGGDMRYSQVSSNMRYSNQSHDMVSGQAGGAGLGVTMPPESENRGK
ncbi:hypothetical protein H072_5533 [Dactylellina haptotyla CBS 200.50]|uniref:Uncharacterized protein n=1 Tax=Dactylellina haptotyla (strain CBS 200.50) TaxID=1284197 RepID=S8AC45_DACHA|nr:hypothetical protein H072_5533 [Dactylellina haptotyla CBS 200.50]